MSTRMRSASSSLVLVSVSTPMSLPMPMHRLGSTGELHAGEADTSQRDASSPLTPSRLLGTTGRSEVSDFYPALHVGGAHTTTIRHDLKVYKYTLLIHGVVIGLFIPL